MMTGHGSSSLAGSAGGCRASGSGVLSAGIAAESIR
jgi:hypothetical protein